MITISTRTVALLTAAALMLPAAAFAQDADLSKDAEESAVGWFLAPQGRVMTSGNRLSHAWGMEGGVTLWDAVNIGMTYHQRSGPVNSEDFTTELSPGDTYKGKTTLELGSEFVYFGLLVSPQIPLPGTESFRLEVPLSVGFGGAGFYLAGKDRETPDGDRVSVWEDRLFDGKDFAMGMGFDAGLRAVWTPTEEDWFRLGFGVHYTSVEFEAFARQSPFFDGLSTSVTVMLGRM